MGMKNRDKAYLIMKKFSENLQYVDELKSLKKLATNITRKAKVELFCVKFQKAKNRSKHGISLTTSERKRRRNNA